MCSQRFSWFLGSLLIASGKSVQSAVLKIKKAQYTHASARTVYTNGKHKAYILFSEKI